MTRGPFFVRASSRPCSAAAPPKPPVVDEHGGSGSSIAPKQSGLTFAHFNGMTGDFYYPEVMPPGVALLDFDNDGDLDVFVLQGDMFSGKPIDKALVPPTEALEFPAVS